MYTTFHNKKHNAALQIVTPVHNTLHNTLHKDLPNCYNTSHIVHNCSNLCKTRQHVTQLHKTVNNYKTKQKHENIDRTSQIVQHLTINTKHIQNYTQRYKTFLTFDKPNKFLQNLYMKFFFQIILQNTTLNNTLQHPTQLNNTFPQHHKPYIFN